MIDPTFQGRIYELVKQLADLQPGIRPDTLRQAVYTSTVSSLRAELAAVSLAVTTGSIARHIHAKLDQQEMEISTNFFLAAP